MGTSLPVNSAMWCVMMRRKLCELTAARLLLLFSSTIAVPFYLLSHAHKTTSIKAAGMHSNIFCEFLKPGEPGEEVEKNTRVMGGNNLSKSFHLFPGLQYT